MALTRLLAGAVGAGSIAVGSVQYAAPQAAARRFGIRLGPDPTATIMMRGTGARDCVTGSALLYSAACGGDYRPWLAMRAGADGVAGALSLLAGTATARQARTTASALLLSVVEFLLWRVSGRAQDATAAAAR